MSKLWIKLWVDILHDFKIVDLPEFIQLRFIKLLLLAAEFDDNGRLPSVKHIAHGFEFYGQKPFERTSETLSALKQAGVIDEDQQGWFVVNWNKRQAPADPTAAERQRRYRERNITRDVARIQPASTSTSTSASSSLNKEESLKRDISEISTLYSNEIGELTRMSSEILSDAIEDYTADWIKAAIAEAVRQNARSWAYVEAILTRWKRDGFQSKKSREATEPDAGWINVTELRLAEEANNA